MHAESYVYFVANAHNNVLYVGVTSDLISRIYQHKNKLVKGFTQKYNVHKLVYYEIADIACFILQNACKQKLSILKYLSIFKHNGQTQDKTIAIAEIIYNAHNIEHDLLKVNF